MSRCLRSFITLFFLLITFSGSAQRVGVVMSGGGAKGLYHIGVLEALEENGIPIDYVAGTSMGSIVAGLYAAGYSPAQMREIVTSGEIESWLTGRISSSYGAYYRQYRSTPSLFSLRLDTKNFAPLNEEVVNNYNNGAEQTVTDIKRNRRRAAIVGNREKSSDDDLAVRPSLYLPSSLISSTQVDMTLTRLFAGASAQSKGNFDDLMVPFLCVASDMRNHQAVILTDGDLGEAIRASMAIPIAFKPIARDTMLLFDGGIYDNFPWKPLQERHAPDVLIGSICTEGNTDLTEQSSLIDQIFAITTNKSDYTLPGGNPTIQRNVPVGMLDFAQGESVIELGYNDTMEQMEQIKGAIEERRDSTFYEARRAEYQAQVKPLLFEGYEVNGLTTEQSLYVRDFLHTSKKDSGNFDRDMPFSELQDNLYRILSNGDFSTEYPTVKYNEISERYKLYIYLNSKPQLKLSVGGHLSSTAFNQIFLSLNYKQIRRVAQSYYADLYLGTVATSCIFGGRTDFFINTPLFMDYYFSYSSINMQYSNLGNLTDVTNSESVKTRDSHFSVAGGVPLSQRSLLTLRVNIGWNHYYYDALEYNEMVDIDPNLLYDRTRMSFGATKLEYQRSTFNRMVYPTRGSKLEISAIAVMASERNYQSLSGNAISSPSVDHQWVGGRVKYDKYFTPPSSSWFSLGFNVDAVYTTLQQFGNPTSAMLTMPSYQPVVHSQMIFMPDFSGDKYIGAGVIPTFDLGSNMLLRTGFYGLYRNAYSIDGVTESLISARRHHYIVESAFVYNSSLGSLSLSLTKYDLHDWNNLYLTFGFGIPIFAPKGTFY
ncbi:MAG: patatin-like phospholipase family protein [Rikenellaceae bacterium]